MARPIAALFCMLALSGCTALGGPECPTTEQKDGARAGYDFFDDEDFGDRAITMLIDGRMDGENADATLAISPSQKAVRTTAAEGEFRLKGNYFSIEDTSGDIDAFSGYGRNHKPGAAYADFLKEMNDDSEDDVSFADDLEFSDLKVECTTLGDLDTLTMSYEDDDRELEMVVEDGGQYRPLTITVKDEISDDNFRASISYDEPVIVVDESLPRIPFTVRMDSLSAYVNERDGILETVEVETGSEWVPLSEVLVQLTDGETIYVEEVLRDGFQDWQDGDTFEFDDRDSNGLLSDGDRLTYDFGPGLYLAMWDKWANAETIVENL